MFLCINLWQRCIGTALCSVSTMVYILNSFTIYHRPLLLITEEPGKTAVIIAGFDQIEIRGSRTGALLKSEIRDHPTGGHTFLARSA